MTTVYSKKNCVKCDATKRALSRNSIPYEEKVISLDSEEAERLRDQGFQEFPVVYPGNGGEPWTGFQLDKIKELAV